MGRPNNSYYHIKKGKQLIKPINIGKDLSSTQGYFRKV